METWTLHFCLILVLNSPATAVIAAQLRRADFPSAFIFGSGTSAYQVEGAALEDGRTPSIWDTFAHQGKVHGNGDMACDQYHKYKDDVQLMVEIGLDAYRFSISWSRLIPYGRGPVNPEGVAYYSNLINELISHGIQPHVTLFHSDTPQALEDEYGGWLSPKIVKDFTMFANVCFREFGDRVQYWTTFNEGNVFVMGGYDIGFSPPGRCSSRVGFFNCTRGNSSTEPYTAAHHILLAHASAARLYKRKYQGKQLGFIVINVLATMFIPLTNTIEDALATQRANDFFHGWFLNPLVFGDYPDTMKKNVGERMMAFTQHESKQINGSFDFIGINHYLSAHVKNDPSSLNNDHRDFLADVAAKIMFIGGDAPHEFPIRPWALQGVLEYLKQAYGNPPIIIHENGQKNRRNASLDDTQRVKYMEGYIGALLHSVRNGSNTRGYFVWAFLDVFELLDGYDSGFGLYYVDLDDRDFKRYPKLSAHWYSTFLKGGNPSLDGTIQTQNNLSGHSQAHFTQ